MRQLVLVPLIAIATATIAFAQTAAPAVPDCADVARAVQDMMRQDARLRDWAQLSRYRDANAEVKSKNVPVQVVFLGDSITDSWSNPAFGGFFPGKPYLNRGISGQTTPQMLIRMQPDVLAFEPKAMVLLAGTNDIAGNTGPMTNEDIENNIASIAQLASANGVKVVLASIMPVSDYHVGTQPGALPQTARRPPERITALNAWLKGYAAAHGHVYLDYFSAMVDGRGMLKAELSADDLHPTAAGYAIMAPLAEAAIAKALQ
jgi:lysophospholipase L1-like esterase